MLMILVRPLHFAKKPEEQDMGTAGHTPEEGEHGVAGKCERRGWTDGPTG